ncbi:hypothetical protein DERF_004221 [Dermatophagoides farinae]|uniref:Uncharacterized protein n=2 Tax=Dermatophagoides farinae TaxID=6954 RepID=A0A922I1Z3_DERFA|nr:hypothetical protein HUG17_0384 [Dermatophagoides farinae]KAH9520516.1 hypothetical protein DERF_004221 [Dermatophagoides farinae]
MDALFMPFIGYFHIQILSIVMFLIISSEWLLCHSVQLIGIESRMATEPSEITAVVITYCPLIEIDYNYEANVNLTRSRNYYECPGSQGPMYTQCCEYNRCCLPSIYTRLDQNVYYYAALISLLGFALLIIIICSCCTLRRCLKCHNKQDLHLRENKLFEMSHQQQPNHVGHHTSQQTFGPESKSNHHRMDDEWLPVMDQVDDSPLAHYYSNPNPNVARDDHNYVEGGIDGGSCLPMPSILINPLADHRPQNWQAQFLFEGMV